MDTTQRLPNELWLLVSEACDVPGRSNLAQTTRHLYHLLNERLHKSEVQENGSMLLHWAVENNIPSALQLALACGADPLEPSIAQKATPIWNRELADVSVFDGVPENCRALHWALTESDFHSGVHRCGDERVHCNSALSCALWCCRPDFVRTFLNTPGLIGADKLNTVELDVECSHGKKHPLSPPLYTALKVYYSLCEREAGRVECPFAEHLLRHHTKAAALENVRLLLEAGADPNMDSPHMRWFGTPYSIPLGLAADTSVLQLLLLHGADFQQSTAPGHPNPLANAIAMRDDELLDQMLTALLSATSEYRTIQTASETLAQLVYPDRKYTPQDIPHAPADTILRDGLVRTLLAFGGDPNFLYPLGIGRGAGCALDFAVIRSDRELVEMFLRAGAIPEMNAVCEAARMHDCNMTALLLFAAFRMGDINYSREVRELWERCLRDEFMDVLVAMLEGGANEDLLMDWWNGVVDHADEDLELQRQVEEMERMEAIREVAQAEQERRDLEMGETSEGTVEVTN